MEMASCPHCGNRLYTEESVCPYCGFSLERYNSHKKNQNRIILFLVIIPILVILLCWLAFIISVITIGLN
ncbi:MAG: DUF2116 family Zn-ribbon domain-containing protein [Paludibacteraceae bacterium]|nr:DUF2116 family Zn-ribbon domain-containing protein [Paludibacteraceae bacterium]